MHVLTLPGPTAAIATAAFFVVAPGTFAGLIPWLISGWEFHQPLTYCVVAQVVGVLLIVAGISAPVHAFVQFAQAGGTPIPIAPTQRLVVTGFNRYVRNPMYLGLLTVIVGQALLFGQFSLLLYAAAGWIVTASFVFKGGAGQGFGFSLMIGRASLPPLAWACCYALPAIASRTAGTISRAQRATAVARSLSALRKMNPRAP